MAIATHRLLRVELTVTDLNASERFFADALGFTPAGRSEAVPAYARLLGAERVRQATLRRLGQTLVLMAFTPEGAAYPHGTRACDAVFQHIALPVTDIGAAYERLTPFAVPAISRGGPQQLPPRAGGVAAFKFRDPDGHPLELIRFPGAAKGGIDHSAIAVADAERSIAFYCERLGFRVGSRQVNTGSEQDALDGLDAAAVDVVALQPEQASPHVELLAYRHPQGRPASPHRPCDIAATRLVLEVSGLDQPMALLADPDGHLLVLQPRSDD